MSTEIGHVLTGAIAQYVFVVAGDEIRVTRADGKDMHLGSASHTHAMPGFETWYRTRNRVIKVGWGRFHDDSEVIYLYDKSSGNFGYAVNLHCDWCSEWGYAPFAVDETVTQIEDE